MQQENNHQQEGWDAAKNGPIQDRPHPARPRNLAKNGSIGDAIRKLAHAK
jgi:hypothetical protein